VTNIEKLVGGKDGRDNILGLLGLEVCFDDEFNDKDN